MFIFEIVITSMAFLLMLLTTYYESGLFFTIGLFVSAIIMVGIITLPVVINFVMSNILMIVIGFVVYFIVGGIWSIFKWWRFNVDIKKQYDEIIAKNPNASMSAILNSFEGYAYNDILTIPPLASNMKSKIVMWIVSWPLSIITWILGDLIVSICNSIYDILGNVYSKITKSIFGDNVIKE